MKIVTEFLERPIVFLDLDGVLCDFEDGVRKLGHGFFDDDKDKDPIIWAAITKRGSKFWANLEWTVDGRDLWLFVKKYRPTILSALGGKYEDAIQGKEFWIKKNLGPNVKSILCKRSEKQNYSKENAILIDDQQRNIEEWTIRGGVAILHKNASDTISKLKGILKRY